MTIDYTTIKLAGRSNRLRRVLLLLTCGVLQVCSTLPILAQSNMFYRDDEASSRSLTEFRTIYREASWFTDFCDDHGQLSVDALRQALRHALNVETMTEDERKALSREQRATLWRKMLGQSSSAARLVGVFQVRELEADLEAVFIHASDPSQADTLAESLQILRGANAGAAAQKYLDVIWRPSSRSSIYWQISMSAGDALTTLSARLAMLPGGAMGQPVDQEAEMIIGSMGRIPTNRAAQRLMRILDDPASSVPYRAAALTGLGILGRFHLPVADRLRYEAKDGTIREVIQHQVDQGNFNKEVAAEDLLTESACNDIRQFVLLHAKSDSEELRKRVAATVAAMLTRESYRVLETMIKSDPSPAVRQAAQEAKQEMEHMVGGSSSIRFRAD